MGHSHLPLNVMRAWRNGRRARLRIWCLWRMSSSLIARTFLWHPICGSSSVGRAPPCQGGGRESEPRLPLHFLRGCSSMAELQPSKLATRVRFPSPAPSAIHRARGFAVVAQLVERHLAKVEVASPSLVYRSIFFAGVAQWQSSSLPSWLRGSDSRHPLHLPSTAHAVLR